MNQVAKIGPKTNFYLVQTIHQRSNPGKYTDKMFLRKNLEKKLKKSFDF